MSEGIRTGENFSFNELFSSFELNLEARVATLASIINQYRGTARNPYHRVIVSRADREVGLETDGGNTRNVLMFGSNNYLGFAGHPHLTTMIGMAIDKWGCGLAGPPHLNGYTSTARDLEQRLAAFKGKEDAMLFSSGFAANMAVAASLPQPRDIFIYDENSHASLFDGIRLSQARSRRFRHNDVDDLQRILERAKKKNGQDLYVGVEGVYSMGGDVAPLDQISALVAAAGGILVLDDAHGTGVLGHLGRGTADHFNVVDRVDLVVGTFSKTFAVTGGFVAGKKGTIDYLRFAARSYMFSASLPPFALAAVHAGLDLLESEPVHIHKLRDNIAYAERRLNELPYNFNLKLSTPIISLPAPDEMSVRDAVCSLNSMGIFVNPVEFPAVPSDDERFRISLSATHSPQDVDRLVDGIDAIWKAFRAGGLRK